MAGRGGRGEAAGAVPFTDVCWCYSIPHSYRLEHRYLLALIQRDAKEPYLLFWIADDEPLPKER